ncbi:hypothetical protein PY093_13120 [Cytobacillus sp. S13-E01]|uniref:hypothetical protein n=1 Tax=Cytobacillus sp. S13-E01 TaxID=3031326 RepID=UPI0023D7DE41|nr:hypothetical protein [Cytobacillus sp. S13-E01]MDF0727628.1 hypothetical protein [Cytobacillus sp. S13-E01]
MIFLLLSLLTIGLIINFVQKYILRIKEPNIEELWVELEQEPWFKELIQQPRIKDFVKASMITGLLRDPHYVRKIIDQEGHRDGFIQYVIENTNK